MSKYYVSYDNKARTLTEIRELAREACREVLDRLGLDLVRDREGRAQKEIDVTVQIKRH